MRFADPPRLHLPVEIHAERQLLFASDFHLGAPDAQTSRNREKRIVAWMESWEAQTAALFLMGDVFDFWHEYRHVVPKGFVRILGKLAEWVDAGIPVHLFTGNHDLWMYGYLEQEIGLTIHRHPRQLWACGKRFYLAHGDGLGPGDHGYKLIKRIFTNRWCQWLFRQVHPDRGIGWARYFSQTSRKKTGHADAQFLGADREWLILHAQDVLRQIFYDYFIFGHRHYPITWPLKDPQGNSSCYVNLGDWIRYFSYAAFDGAHLSLKYHEMHSLA